MFKKIKTYYDNIRKSIFVRKCNNVIRFIAVRPLFKKIAGITKFGIKNYIAATKRERMLSFPHELAIVACAKNEGSYFKEWLDFHILVGVTKFYIYDNESDDNTKDVLQPYIDKGIVEYIYWPGKKIQRPIVHDAIKRFKMDARWFAHIDLDEFIVPVETETVSEFLRTLPPGARELVITWINYGSSGHKARPDGMVMENYVMRTKKPYGTKAIFNPRFITKFRVHVSNVAGDIVDENGKKLGWVNYTFITPPVSPPPHAKIRINHYYCKSFEEYSLKRNRGSAATGDDPNKYNQITFERGDKNDIYDPIMEKYIPLLKRM